MSSSETTYITLTMEESIIDYFQAVSRPTSGLITNSLNAKFDVAITIMNVLCVIDQDGRYEKQRPLGEYAVTFWIQHLQNVDIVKCSVTQITQVVESLYSIFEKPDRASLLVEAYSNGLYPGFNAAIDPLTPISGLIVSWCSAARQFPLPQPLTDWIRNAAENPTGIPTKLACEHFRHWLDSVPTRSTASIFKTVFEAVVALGWDANLPAPNYAADARTEQEIKYVGSFFSDINRDSSAYCAIGVTFSDHGHHESAITQFNISLDLADNDNHKIYPRIQRAYAFQELERYDLACKDIDQALRDDFGRMVEYETDELSVDITNEKIALLDPDLVKTISRHIVSAALRTEKTLDDARIGFNHDWLLKAYTIRAEFLAAQSNPQAAAVAYKQAIFVAYRDQIEGASDLFRSLLQQNQEIGDYQGLMRQVKNLPAAERRSFIWERCTEHLTYEGGQLLFRAAKLSGLKEDLLGFFKDLRKHYINKSARQAWCSYPIALAYWRYFNDEDAAYNELNKIYDQFYGPEGLDLTRSSGYEPGFAITVMAMISTLLAEIVFSRIYSSPVKWVKSLLIHDLERVSTSVLMNESDNQTQLALQGSTLVARAYLDHGKIHPGIDRLAPIFTRCVEALTDQDGDNDILVNNELLVGYEDLNPDSVMGCDGCDKPETMCKWDRRSYMCLVCANVDLCRECYDKRMHANKANEVFSSCKNYCGFNHDYLEGPITEWGGVKDGIISLGNEKIKFQHWLKDLESKWEEMSLRMPPRRKTMHI